MRTVSRSHVCNKYLIRDERLSVNFQIDPIPELNMSTAD